MWRKLRSSWFLASLAVVLVVGLGAAPQLEGVVSAIPRLGLIAAIMFVTALPIDFAATSKAHGASRAVGLAVAINTIVAPLGGGLAALALPGELAVGLVVAAASPCTVASAAVWTRRGKGNDGVAVLVTIITTLACFLVMPFWTGVLLGQSAGHEGLYTGLVLKLLAAVVAPIVVAQLLRKSSKVDHFAKTSKASLSLAAQIGVLAMAFVGAVESGLKLRSMPAPLAASDWLLVAVLAAVLHTSLLIGGWWTAKSAGIARAEAIAVAIAGSQKTLAVGIGIALEFGGLAIFPMIAYHVLQLLIDTVFVDRVRA